MEFLLDYYDERTFKLNLPKENIIKGFKNEEKKEKVLLDKALNNPINSKRLVELAKNAKKILIVVEDHTRHSPIYETLVEIKWRFSLEKIQWNKVAILVATGTHRKMTDLELKEKFKEFKDFSEIIQHDAYNSELKEFGSFLDVPLKINSLVDYDLVVCIGAIVPHRFSGWSGGSKMIVPGIAGYETVFKSHHMAILNSSANVGIYNNEFRNLINETGKRVGVNFIINYYFDSNGEIAGCVAGEPVSTHEKGVKLAKKYVETFFNYKSDVTFISSYPSVNDFWQSGKALYTADLITKDSGRIIMISPLFEGFGDHPIFAKKLCKSSDEILESLNNLKGEDPLAFVAAYAVKKIMEKKKISIISETKYSEEFKKIGIDINLEVDSFVNEIVDKNLKVIVLNNTLILPRINGQEEIL